MYIVIVNPIAGYGSALKRFQKIQRDVSFKNNQCRTFFTEYKGHAEEIAAQIAEIYKEQVKTVIVIGGDGTFHEVMNGLNAYPQIPMAFIPAGSGNDFARGAGIPNDPLNSFKHIIRAPRKLTFLPGTYQLKLSPRKRKFFMNSIGIGFDAAVANKAEGSLLKRFFNRIRIGSLSYVTALLAVLPKYEALPIMVKVDGNVVHDTRALMVTVANHPYYGGGMKIAPQASLKDELYSIIIIERIAKWKILLLFITVFFGKHTSLREVKEYKGKSIIIESVAKIPVQIDGETTTTRRCRIEKAAQRRTIYY
ncbi:putative lipid kinase YtlR [Thalassobacillus devorans]|uniref:Lipid kinase YtlR n=1 Tax=Thalassobacillus devorans TaxID=279813 RepID=A0ABQ1PBV5_9BACI|nr:diacylglycerol kinase family protein [Thalassobacillus devorans]NIK29955.1 YegS/Rv2252/BmrU family lipid kinase [Thalassobacillus devorans]GGC94184.1 putative lipid kinase YtlR [Thalassobacillus devorans]